MQTLNKFFSSYITTFVLLIIYVVVTAVATFVENSSGTSVARFLVYNAPYFNVLNLLLIFNMIAISFKEKMYTTRKLPSLIFHLAFVVVILGAGVTRFFGYSGNMHIREGETSNIITTSEPYFTINLDNNKLI